jgi:hypothetical protein
MRVYISRRKVENALPVRLPKFARSAPPPVQSFQEAPRVPVTSENTPAAGHLSRAIPRRFGGRFRPLTASNPSFEVSWGRFGGLGPLPAALRVLEESGLFVNDRYGKPLPHPAVAIERDGRLAYARPCSPCGPKS